jgi:hypothetical protein
MRISMMSSLVMFFGLGLVGQDDAVAQHVAGDLLDILRRGIGAAVQHGVGAAARFRTERGARRGAVFDLVASLSSL